VTHGFDLRTLTALCEQSSTRVVSDDIAWHTYYKHGSRWIPQQIGAWQSASGDYGPYVVTRIRHGGIHRRFQSVGATFHGQISGFKDIRLQNTQKSMLEHLYHGYF